MPQSANSQPRFFSSSSHLALAALVALSARLPAGAETSDDRAANAASTGNAAAVHRHSDDDAPDNRADVIQAGAPTLEAIGPDGQPLRPAPTPKAKKRGSKSARNEEATPAPSASPASAASYPMPAPTPVKSPGPDGPGKAAAPPTPTATATAAPVQVPLPLSPTATPMPAPKAAAPPAAPGSDALANQLKLNCAQHFPGQIQSEVRAACQAAAPDFARLGRSLVETRCRLNYGEEPRLIMACLVGVAILSDEMAGRDDYRKKLALCNETYPVHNEIDAFLQESCLTGIHIPDLGIVEPGQTNASQDTARICSQITPERSFLGPCAVGLSLTRAESMRVSPEKQTAACEKYFNLHRFHQGYRACLNARAVAAQMQLPATGAVRYSQVLQACSEISSSLTDENERAACFVGLDLFRQLGQQKDIDAQFKKCGDNKVTFQDRDFLACLTAASLLDFTDKNGADAGCREIFKTKKSASRGDCVDSVSQL